MQSQSISGQGRALHHVDPHGRAARSTHSRVRAHVKTLLVATTALVALLAAGGEAALAAVPLSSNSEPVWQPNGVVRAIEPSANGSTAFIGGEFDYVGPYTGSSVQLDQAAGDAAGSWPTFGGGSVHDIVAAPGGGWFVAGSFTTVNGLPRKGVARLTPFGTVDLAFVPGGSGATGGAVSSIEVFDGDVVIAGEFTSYNGSAANIARLDDVTGAVIPAFTSGGTFDDSIKSLATDGTWLYVAGAFTSHGATPTAYLARLAPSGALDTGWLTTQPNNLVSAIAVEGQRLYVGGAFTTMDGVSKSRLAAFDLSTVGDDVDPAFTAGFNAPVEVVHAAGASVYVAGGFTSPTSNLARIDAATGVNQGWNPQGTAWGASLRVRSFHVTASHVYVGGSFLDFNGTHLRSRVARFVLSSGVPSNVPDDQWKPNVGRPVNVIAAGPSGSVLLGGDFSSVGGVMRKNVAQIDLDTGEATSWTTPAITWPVHALAEYPSMDRLYVGGGFSNGAAQFAARRTDTGANVTLALPAFQTNPGVPVTDMEFAGGTLVAVGNLLVSVPLRDGIVGLLPTGALDSGFNPGALPGALDVEYVPNPTDRIYVAGPFGLTRLLGTGSVDSAWGAPAFTGGTTVSDVTADDTAVWFLGSFTGVNSQPRQGRASLAGGTSGGTSTSSSWNPAVTGVTGALRRHGAELVLGGTFSVLAGEGRTNLGAVDPALPSLASAWNPILPPTLPTTIDVIASAGSRVIVSGGPNGGLGIYDTSDDLLAPWSKVVSITDTAPASPADATYVPAVAGADVYVRTIGGATPTFTATVQAHDRYRRAQATYPYVSGLRDVRWSFISPNTGAWTPSDVVMPGAPRGLVTDCWKTYDPGTDPARYLGRRIDRAIDYAFGTNDPDKLPSLPAAMASAAGYTYGSDMNDGTSHSRLSCRWTGHVVAPDDPVGATVQAKLSGDNGMRANIGEVVGSGGSGGAWPTFDEWLSDETDHATLPSIANESLPLNVEWWEQSGDGRAMFEWDAADGATMAAVPEAAFVTRADYEQTFQLLDGAGATNGSKSLEVRAFDREGNTFASMINVVVDNVLPTAGAFTIPGFGWSSTGAYVVDVPSVTETGSGIHSLVLERRWYDGLTAQACTGTFTDWTSVGGGFAANGTVNFSETGLVEGCYQYRYVITDNVGNVTTVEPTGQNASTWMKVDTSEAVGGGMTYTAGTTNAASVTATWTIASDPDSLVSSTDLYRDRGTLAGGLCGSWTGNAYLTSISPTVGTYTDTSTASGFCYRYVLRITNGTGDARTAVVGPIIKVDRDAPSAALSASPGPIGGSVPVTPSASDGLSTLASAVVTFSGPGGTGTICSTAGAGPWSPGACSWDTTGLGLADGIYTLTLTATDQATNVSTPTQLVTIDNSVPTMSGVTLTEGTLPAYQHVDTSGAIPELFVNPAAPGTGSMTVSVDATDTPAGIQVVNFGGLGPNWSAAGTDVTPTGANDTYSYPYSFFPGAVTAVGMVEAVDWLGHNVTRNFQVTADPDVPTGGSITYPNGVAAVATLALDPGTDAGSGLATSQVLRRSAPLDGNQLCPASITSAAWTATGMPSWTDASPLVAGTTWDDTTVQRGFCYQYALELRDNVGNVAPLRTSPNTFVTDAVGLVITPTSSTTVTEGGAGATFDVSLRAAPTADVSVTYVGDGQVGPAAAQTLTFTTSDWNVARPITIGAINDLRDEPSPQTAAVTFQIASPMPGGDAEYDATPDVSRSLSVVDDDVAGLDVATAAGGVRIAEPATSATYAVKLTSQPTGTVTVTTGHGTQAKAMPATLTFDATNWNVAKTVTVQAVDDPDIEGAHATAITNTVTATNAADAPFANLPVASVPVAVADDDTAGFDLDGPINPELNEADSNVIATVRARLHARPTSDVTLTWGTAAGQLTPSAPLTFTPANWNQWQTSTISAANDTVAEPPLHQVIGEATLASGDANFAGVAPKSGTITIRDNDPAVFVTSPGANWTTNDEGQLLLDESATSGSVLRIRAGGDPTSDVTITPSASPAEQLVISPASQTIPAGSHEQVVTFSVRAANDREQELDPHPAKVTWKVTTSDAMYGGAAIPVTVVRIKDGEATTPRENTPTPTPTPDPTPTPTPTPDPGPQTGGDGSGHGDDTTPDPTGDPIGDDGDDAPGDTVADDGSVAGDDGVASTTDDTAKRTSRAAATSKNPAKRLKKWASENKGKASVAASAAGTAAIWGAKPLALAGKALMSGGGGLPGHPPGMGQVRHLFKRKVRAKVKRFWRGKKRDVRRDDDDDWDDFLWGDRAA